MKSAILRRAGRVTPVAMESLEVRRLLSDGPQILNSVADDRGKATFLFNQALNPASISNNSVEIFTKDAGGVFDVPQTVTVTYRAVADTIVAKTSLPPETPYKVVVLDTITNTDNLQLDGEFNGPGTVSGNGTPGGQYIYQTSVKSPPVAIFTTSLGNMTVAMDSSQVQATVANFISYADSGEYDNTIIHRDVIFFVFQGGGYPLTVAQDQIGTHIHQNAPIADQAGLANAVGTIAMANSGANTATSEWFFNLVDNSSQNSGTFNSTYTVFGNVNSPQGLATMYAIGALPIINLQPGVANPTFNTVPIRDPVTALQRGFFDPNNDCVIVQRIAMKMNISAVPGSSPGIARAVATPAVAFSSTPLTDPSASATSDILTSQSASLLD